VRRLLLHFTFLAHPLAEALIADINTDVKVALNCLQREAYVAFANDEYFAGSEPPERTNAETAASK
jgi:hypothetical protein